MSGLRIVLEESRAAQMLRSDEAVALRQSETPEDAAAESLLPPLPETEEEISSPAPVVGATVGTAGPGPAHHQRPAPSPRVLSSPCTLKEHQQCVDPAFGSSVASAAVPAIDMSSLSMDASVFSFPSVDSPSPSSASFPVALAKSSSSTSINSSPLKRLKSLKDGFRRLSLSRKNSASSMPAPVADLNAAGFSAAWAPLSQLSQPLSAKPATYSINADPCAHDASSSSSTSESLRSSTFSCSASVHNPGHSHHPSASMPMAPSHMATSSQGSSTMAKCRRRTISQSNSTSSTTPPLPSPIITLSENLASSRQSLMTIEQNYFDKLPAAEPGFTVEMAEDGSSNSLSMLNTSDDLIDYSIYLSQHKKSVEAAYEVSKSKLVSSGWCSGHDIENLVLHRDSVLSQIDSKLLQIEAKLNADFNMSILNNPRVDMRPPPALSSHDMLQKALSPSLKDLESRCLFSTSSNLFS